MPLTSPSNSTLTSSTTTTTPSTPDAPLVPNISCHAWNNDQSLVAFSPNTNEIYIYATNSHPQDVSQWTRKYVLDEHSSFVSGIDWSSVNNQIVTCGHDRNAYVWKYDTTSDKWQPTLVLLRVNRAATCVKWSPDGKKFAVGSGAKQVAVCHYEASNDWWISKMIKKSKSTVLSVEWSPNSKLLITGGSDSKCRIFSAYMSGVDEVTSSSSSSSSSSNGASGRTTTAAADEVYSPRIRALLLALISFFMAHISAHSQLVQQFEKSSGDKKVTALIESNKTSQLSFHFGAPTMLLSCPAHFRQSVIAQFSTLASNKTYSTVREEITMLATKLEVATDHTRNLTQISSTYMPLDECVVWFDQVLYYMAL